MKSICIFSLLTGFFFTALSLPAQNRCESLRQEEEQLNRRLREVREELRNCGTPSPSECPEKVLFAKSLEVRTQCAEIKGGTLVIHFRMRNGGGEKASQKYSVYNLNSMIFDQEGRSFKGKRLTISNSTTEAGYLNPELVYNVWYKGSIEFYIGSQNVTNISLFKFSIGGSEPLGFEDLEIK